MATISILAILMGKALTILSLRRGCAATTRFGLSAFSFVSKTDQGDVLLSRNIAYYQGASYAFQQHLLTWKPTAKSVKKLAGNQP